MLHKNITETCKTPFLRFCIVLGNWKAKLQIMTGPRNHVLKVRRKDFHCSVSIIQQMRTKLHELHVSLLPALPFAVEQSQLWQEAASLQCLSLGWVMKSSRPEAGKYLWAFPLYSKNGERAGKISLCSYTGCLKVPSQWLAKTSEQTNINVDGWKRKKCFFCPKVQYTLLNTQVRIRKSMQTSQLSGREAHVLGQKSLGPGKNARHVISLPCNQWIEKNHWERMASIIASITIGSVGY